MFRFAKKKEFLTKGGIRCIFRVFLGVLFFRIRGPSLVELTGDDNCAALALTLQTRMPLKVAVFWIIFRSPFLLFVPQNIDGYKREIKCA